MKFTVEVEEFWLEEEQLASALAHNIKTDVVQQIEKSIKDRIEKQITMEVKAQVEASMYKLIQAYTQEHINSGKVPSRKKRGEEITLAEYITETFTEKVSSYADPSEIVKKVADAAVNELKKRYDTMFATQIVMKLRDNNMLNEQGTNLLLNDKS